MKIVDPNEKVNSEVKESNIEFFQITDLPSNFKFYPKNTKILGRRLKVPEVKKLAELNKENFDLTINLILEQCIKGIDIEDLKVADELYIIFWLRANTYKESGYVQDFYCSTCSADSEYEFDLDNLNIVHVKDEFKKEQKYENIKIEIDPVSVKIENEKESIINENENIDKEDLTIATNIGKINDKDLTLLDKYNFIRNDLSPTEYVKLKTYIENNEFGFEPTLNAKCNKCGGITPVGISFCSSFFIPRYRS